SSRPFLVLLCLSPLPSLQPLNNMCTILEKSARLAGHSPWRHSLPRQAREVRVKARMRQSLKEEAVSQILRRTGLGYLVTMKVKFEAGPALHPRAFGWIGNS